MGFLAASLLILTPLKVQENPETICATGNTCRGSIHSSVPPLPPSAQQDKSELTLPCSATCLAYFASDNRVGGSNKFE